MYLEKKQDIADNDRNNGTDRDADTEVDNIKEAIGGVTSMKLRYQIVKPQLL